MSRLTRRIGESIIDFVDGKGYAQMSHQEGVRLLFNRLAAYEDTGLTPEEITANMEMFAAYRRVCGGKSPDEVTQAFAENARLRAELAEQQRETASCDYLLGEADIGARAAGGEIKELKTRLELVERERDKAVADMTSIADAIANCKEYLSGGRDKVSSLQLGRCLVCKRQCHDDKPCKFEWCGTEGKA